MAATARAVDRRFTSTTFDFPGYKIAQIHGVVRGITVRNPNIGKAFVAGIAAIGGGENSGYLEMAEKAREKSFQRLLEHAAAAGGNAVLGIRYDANDIMQGMTEVLAYGTAVTLVPINGPPPSGASQSSPSCPSLDDIKR
ncbi:uncharacterized protein VTP21DRAFT_9083 [Calcarisporiella thermophila]|uniref:uncharacterized protein n=1 Tax=Calcarisporiella thermophila TaxID=911321 RepID=UPI00374316EB